VKDEEVIGFEACVLCGVYQPESNLLFLETGNPECIYCSTIKVERDDYVYGD